MTMVRINAARLARLSQIELTEGAHSDPEAGMCAMEAASWLAGEPFSDAPACVSPVIAAFCREWNDAPGEHGVANRARLRELLPRLIGTRGTAARENRRAWLALDWLIRVQTPAWLRAAGLGEHADALAALPAQRSLDALESGVAVRVAARAAARDAVRDADWADARGADWRADWDADWDARAAAMGAVWDAARAAHWDAWRASAVDWAASAARDVARNIISVAIGGVTWAGSRAAEGAARNVWDIARDAADVAAWAAARDAAKAVWDAWRTDWDAARDAARDATDWDASDDAWAAAGDAAWAAWDAAKDAAWAALAPTVEALQPRAWELLEALIACE